MMVVLPKGFVPILCADGVQVTIPGTLHEKLANLAGGNGVHVEDLIEWALDQYLQEVAREGC